MGEDLPVVTPLPKDLTEMKRHLEAAYPDEGCGLILRGPGPDELRVRPMRNVYDRYHAQDPERFPRTSRTAYLFDPREWMQVTEEAEVVGAQVACIFHSHGDVGAYFSDEDKAMAAPDGEPLFPEVSYLVVAVDAGKVTGAKLFAWNGRCFEEHPATV
ncbi:MAG TPA: M67 family metallopeptidase [Myxococcaceae bacterium]|nr:M67 family metallopeptidase [Myxococcaceae bacterium]